MARRETPGRGRLVLASANHEAALAVLGERRFKALEIPLQEQLQRTAAEPRRGWRLVADQLQQDLHLGPVVLVPRDDGDRVAVEDLQELLVREAEEQLQALGAQNSWFSPPNTSATESSVKMRRTLSVRRSATESTVMFSGAPDWTGIVSVTTIRSNGLAFRFS